MAVSAETKTHADFAGNRSHGSARNTKQADLFFLAAVPQAVHLLGKFLRSAAGAKNDSDLALLFNRHGSEIEAGIGHRFGGRGQAQRNNPRYMFALACVNPGELVELRDFAADVYKQV